MRAIDIYKQQEDRNSAIRERIETEFPSDWKVSRRIVWGPNGHAELHLTAPDGKVFDDLESARKYRDAQK